MALAPLPGRAIEGEITRRVEYFEREREKRRGKREIKQELEAYLESSFEEKLEREIDHFDVKEQRNRGDFGAKKQRANVEKIFGEGNFFLGGLVWFEIGQVSGRLK